MVATAAAIASILGTGVTVAGQLGRSNAQPQQKAPISESALQQASSNDQYQRALSALINQRSVAGTSDSFGSTLQYDPATNTWVSKLGALPQAEQTSASQAAIARNTTDLRQSQLANENAMRRASMAEPGYDTAVRNLQQFRPQSAEELGALLTQQGVTANNAVMRPIIADTLTQYGRANSNASVPLANLGRQSYDNLRDALISGRIGALQNTTSINNANRQGLESAATTSAGLSNPNLQFSGIQPSQQSAIMANLVADRAKTASTAPAFGASGVNEAQKSLLSGATGAANNVPDPNANLNSLVDAGKTLASAAGNKETLGTIADLFSSPKPDPTLFQGFAPSLNPGDQRAGGFIAPTSGRF